MVCIVGSSVLFVIGLPVLRISGSDFYIVAFNYFCAVYGILTLFYLLRVVVSQNLAYYCIANSINNKDPNSDVEESGNNKH
jgi:hypothetical protein